MKDAGGDEPLVNAPPASLAPPSAQAGQQPLPPRRETTEPNQTQTRGPVG